MAMKPGTETGSMMNHLMSGGRQPEPKVGDGATILGWTDRYAGTIIRVTACQIHVQEDIAKRIDKNGQSEVQEYEYTRDPKGRIYIFRKTKRGWRADGRGLSLGGRRAYHDYSF